MRSCLFTILCLTLFIVSACQEETQQSVQTSMQPSQQVDRGKVETTSPDAGHASNNLEEQVKTETPGQPEQPEEQPPGPPITEDFQDTPKLTLFPRVGDYRPADDSDRLPFWSTFVEHLLKVTDVVENQATGNRVWVFRSINSIDSVGFFSPLTVEPQSTYQVFFTLAAVLTEGASAGIGIIEFNEFLWIPGQYTEETFKEHFRGTHEGARLTGAVKGEHSFTFTTGPETRMIHVVLFREGTHDRNNVMFDDVRIEEVKK